MTGSHKFEFHLNELRKVKRHSHHHLLHHIHKTYRISRKTLFYVKEYGSHANVVKTILKESLKILLLASIVSSFGGLALENIRVLFISIMPLLVLLPSLNDMIGDYGTIISSRLSTLLHEGKVSGNWWNSCELKELFLQVFIVAIVMAAISSGLALLFSAYFGFGIDFALSLKILFIALLDVMLLVIILFFVSVIAGLHFFKKQEDPNNFLIPITTSVADLGNMIILSGLVVFFF